MIATTWTIVTLVIPFQIREVNLTHVSILMQIASLFIFLIALTIPFDMRDYEHDLDSKINSIPIFLGKEKAHLLLMVLLGILTTLQITALL